MFLKYYNNYLGNNSTFQIITIKINEDKLAIILHLLYGDRKHGYLTDTNKTYDNISSVDETLVYWCIRIPQCINIFNIIT